MATDWLAPGYVVSPDMRGPSFNQKSRFPLVVHGRSHTPETAFSTPTRDQPDAVFRSTNPPRVRSVTPRRIWT